MRPCPADDALLLAHYGEGDAGVRHHVAECLHCTARAQRLTSDLVSITEVLEGEPLGVRPRRGHPASWPRLVAAAAVLGMVLLGSVEVLMWRAATSLTRTSPAADSAAAIEEVAAALSPAAEADGFFGLVTAPDADLGVLDDFDLDDGR